ncbi:hypothetical protein [Sphingobium sp.]|jgi:hypothetical protein|uniref:hypothetical protein n=1 Tax=Sphingobium sp. TaxID=1912891 RepID=UPI00257F5C05|nr:hypothetical protein [Sphingobium sp.]MBR2269166.1 hypothetical protein [Sphingobium sp.]
MIKAIKSIFQKAPDVDPILEGLLKQLYPALWIQFDMLGYRGKAFPLEGSYISGQSRGYLIGLAEAICVHNMGDRLSHDVFMAVAAAAFSEAYGDKPHWTILCDTLEEFQRGNEKVLEGAQHAHNDIADVYANVPYATIMGFWLFNNGIDQPKV